MPERNCVIKNLCSGRKLNRTVLVLVFCVTQNENSDASWKRTYYLFCTISIRLIVQKKRNQNKKRMKKLHDVSPSKTLAAKTVYEAFKVLKEEGGQLPGKDVIDKVGQRLQFTDWEKGTLEKTGNVRWISIMHFFTIDCIKAGYMRKVKGTWYMTPEGEQAFKKYDPLEFLESATTAYRKWRAENKPSSKQEEDVPELEENIEQVQKANLDQLEEQAIAGIKDFINKKPLRVSGFSSCIITSYGKSHTFYFSERQRWRH